MKNTNLTWINAECYKNIHKKIYSWSELIHFLIHKCNSLMNWAFYFFGTVNDFRAGFIRKPNFFVFFSIKTYFLMNIFSNSNNFLDNFFLSIEIFCRLDIRCIFFDKVDKVFDFIDQVPQISKTTHICFWI